MTSNVAKACVAGLVGAQSSAATRLAFVLLLSGCMGSMGAMQTSNVPAARLAKNTYTSQDGRYSVTLPPLVQPGMRIEERRLDETTTGVFFADDFGTAYYVLQNDDRARPISLEQHAEQYELGDQLMEKEFVETVRGRELRLVGNHVGASPIVTRTEEDGRWVERPNDLVEAWSVFKHGDCFYRVVAGVTPLHERTAAASMSDAKQRLQAFLDGLVIR
jgi:hypothetical protein